MRHIQLISSFLLCFVLIACGEQKPDATADHKEFAYSGHEAADVLTKDPGFFMGKWVLTFRPNPTYKYRAGTLSFLESDRPNKPIMFSQRIFNDKVTPPIETTRTYEEAVSWLKGKIYVESQDALLYASIGYFYIRQADSSQWGSEIIAQLKSIKGTLDDCGFDTKELRIFDQVGTGSSSVIANAGDHLFDQIDDLKAGLKKGINCTGAVPVALLATAFVDLADQAMEDGEEGDARVYLELAVTLAKAGADVAVGISPLGRTKDVIEALTGYSVIPDHQPLEAWERVVAGVGAVTTGSGVLKTGMQIADKTQAGALVAKGFKNILAQAEVAIDAGKRLGLKSAASMRVYAKLHPALTTLPNNLKVLRIREGADPERIAIIGRSMAGVVEDTAEHLKANGIAAETFAWSDEAREEWDALIVLYKNKSLDGRIPYEEVKKTIGYTENKAWVEKKLKIEGSMIIDLGDPLGKNSIEGVSAFYDMEKELIFGLAKK